jgi:hypothetical protein
VAQGTGCTVTKLGDVSDGAVVVSQSPPPGTWIANYTGAFQVTGGPGAPEDDPEEG